MSELMLTVNGMIDNMQDEEIMALGDMLLQKRMTAISQRLTRLEDKIKKTDEQVEIMKEKQSLINESINEKITDHDEELKKVNKAIYTLENDDTGKFNEFKRCTKSRVFQLVGDSSNYKHILFYDSFISKINNDVAKALNVSRTGKINIDDFQGALVIAKRWYPDRKYITGKVSEFQKLSSKKRLTEKERKKINALEQFLDDIGGDVYAIKF